MSNWPYGNGEMAERIRTYDWAATPIGAIAAWPQPLRTAVEMMLASPMLASLAVGRDRVFLYNDEAARHYGNRHPEVLGLPLATAFAHEFHQVEPFYDRVFAGESLNVPAQPLDPGKIGTAEVFDAYLVPVRDADGHVIAAAMTGFAIGERLRAETKLRESEERLALAFKTLPMGLAIVDRFGKTISSNDKMARYLPNGLIASREPSHATRWCAWDADGAVVDPQDYPDARALRGEEVVPGLPMLYAEPHRHPIWTEVSSAPLRRDSGEIAGALVVVADIDRLKRSEEHQAFLLDLSDSMRFLTDPVEFQIMAISKLAAWLKVDSAGYYELQPDGATLALTARGTSQAGPILDQENLPELGADLSRAYREGRTLVVPDTMMESVSENERLAFRSIQARSSIGVPLIGHGRLAGVVGVHSTNPRDWTPAEISIVEDVAERTWAAAERARAEAALRKSEEKYRLLFESIDEGFCLIEVIFDADDQPVDYRFLEANPAFQRQTGLADAVGRTIFEMVPHHEKRWCEIYGRIARTGKPERFEDQAAALNRWYDVYAFRVGKPEERRVALLFRDVLDRKRAERNSTFLDRLGQDLAGRFEPVEIMQSVGARLSAHLNLSGCVFGDVDEEKREVTIHHGWTADHVPDLRGTYRMSEYRGEELIRANRAGETFVISDAMSDPLADGKKYEELKVAAFVVVPFHWAGRWTSYVAVTSTTPREWTAEEVQLVKSVSDRLFSRLERARAEEALRESEVRQRTLIQGIPQLVWRAVGGGRWTWASPQWTRFTGQAEVDSFGLGWLDVVHPDDRDAVQALWTGSAERGDFTAEFRLCHAGEQRYRWFQSRATPVRDATGQIIEWLGSSTDVEDFRRLQDRQRVLVAELQHRTRNLMAVVRSMSNKTIRASSDLSDFQERFQDRLEALARVQGLLSRLDEEDRVSFDQLIHAELTALGGHSERVVLSGPSGVRLRSSSVQTLALALHELATNAVKYGALGESQGRLSIEWWLEAVGEGGGPWLHIDWRESGVDMPADVETPRGDGQGRELIEQALPYQLSAKTSYTLGSDGVHCTISIPVSASGEMARD